MKNLGIALFMIMSFQAFSANVSSENRNANAISLNDNYEPFRFEPIIKQVDDYIKLGMTNPKMKNVDIIVEDIYGYELVNLQNLDDLFIKKTFDVSNLPDGKYTILVKTSEKTFTSVITVE